MRRRTYKKYKRYGLTQSSVISDRQSTFGTINRNYLMESKNTPIPWVLEVASLKIDGVLIPAATGYTSQNLALNPTTYVCDIAGNCTQVFTNDPTAFTSIAEDSNFLNSIPGLPSYIHFRPGVNVVGNQSGACEVVVEYSSLHTFELELIDHDPGAGDFLRHLIQNGTTLTYISQGQDITSYYVSNSAL